MIEQMSAEVDTRGNNSPHSAKLALFRSFIKSRLYDVIWYSCTVGNLWCGCLFNHSRSYLLLSKHRLNFNMFCFRLTFDSLIWRHLLYNRGLIFESAEGFQVNLFTCIGVNSLNFKAGVSYSEYAYYMNKPLLWQVQKHMMLFNTPTS